VLAALGASAAVLYADAVGALGGTVAAGAVAGASLALAAAVRRSPSRAPALDVAPLAVDPDATAVVDAPRASELAPSAGHSDAA
jgi:hypothetical protein